MCEKCNKHFAVGDTVIASAFADCFGEYHPTSEQLTVREVRLIEDTTTVPAEYRIQSYYRILASGNHQTVEASARFFEKV